MELLFFFFFFFHFSLVEYRYVNARRLSTMTGYYSIVTTLNSNNAHAHKLAAYATLTGFNKRNSNNARTAQLIEHPLTRY